MTKRSHYADAARGVYCDLVKVGIIDQTKVVRTAFDRSADGAEGECVMRGDENESDERTESTTSTEPTTGTTDPAIADMPEVQQAEQQQDKEREEREKKTGK